tara:strand:+ start:493 stop:909 length:417 start_codon:yes stop_codon:yes gene_type:complete
MSFENSFFKILFDNDTQILNIIVKAEYPLVEQELNQLIDSLTIFYEACNHINKKFAILFDLRNLGILTIDYYKKFITFFKSHEEISEKCLICSSIICNNYIINNIINRILLFYKNIRPIKIVDNDSDALEFINSNKDS